MLSLWPTSMESSRVGIWQCGPCMWLATLPSPSFFLSRLTMRSTLVCFRTSEGATGGIAEVRREYTTSLARRRLHQRAFRELVLLAYRNQCALCRLRHSELLDAAHIVPDAEPEGEPVVQNGIALCRLHHAAFDRFFLAVRPDHIIEVRPDVLEEADGPTLQHAIQGLHGQSIVLPRKSLERPGPLSFWPSDTNLSALAQSNETGTALRTCQARSTVEEELWNTWRDLY